MEKEKSPSFKNGGDDETPKCSNGKDPPAPDKPQNNNGTEGKGGGAEATPQIKYTMENAWEDIEHSLVELEGDADSEIPDSINDYLDLVEEKASKHELPEKSKGCPLDDDGSFLKVAHQMSKLYKHLSEIFKLDSRQGILINRIGRIHQQVMCCLEDEFRTLLEESRIVEPDVNHEPAGDGEAQDQAPRSNEVLSNFPGYSQEALATLNKIAMEMISGGYEFECYEAYIMTRRNAIEEILNKLGFEKISIDDVQKMQWDALQREIPPWINAFKACANVYFSGERKLAETVFSDDPSVAKSLFNSLTRVLFLQLLNFAEAVSVSKRSTEKLFKFLDIYEALRDNFSTIDNLFPEECANELKEQLTTTRSRIGETAICIFRDFKNLIQSDTGRTQVPGGAVHPLTRYTMNYLKYACDEYRDTLEHIFKDHEEMERADSTSQSNSQSNDDENRSPFSSHLIKIMDSLDSVLDAKSKLYKDVALSSIFMMNNGRYILQKIKASPEIRQAMGDNWYRKKSFELRNYHQSYKRETWMKLLGCLNLEGLNVNGKVVKPVLKERFKRFNAMFEEIHKTQSLWVVSDKQMQSELRVSITGVIIPAYRSFLGRFSGYLTPGRQTEKYIKFQPEDIETYIEELFDGNTASTARKRT
ncbi:flowering time control protein FY-like [Hibiscus syriacus]|uniref:Exocyst subunit Exo70 family protein n=1 Tax=Hibiscus syriacus TaxID=106335 RepID=A0A6A2XYG9_HIBSY|nr:exocyst complex component EXO70B1-like [Hibiscus syriacus]KAE8661657.1 flowering time control protein FY-like [Hibiscus syriacus]